MAPLRQRILWRAVPAGLATALIGLLLLYLYVPIAQLVFRDLKVEESSGLGRLGGVLMFGLIGFAVAAGLECVRREK